MAATWVILQKDLELIFRLKQSQDFSDFSEKFTDAFSRSTLNLATTTFGQLLTYGNYNLIKSSIKSFLDFNRNLEPNIERLKISLDKLLFIINDISENGNIRSLELPSDIHPLLRKIISPNITDLNKKIKNLNETNQNSVLELNESIEKFKNDVEKLNLELIPYIYLESAFITFWSTVKFSPLPPTPPTISPLFGTSVLTPGVPGILSVGFKNAFTSKDPTIASTIIANSLEIHAKTISGTYSGFIASPSGPIPSPPIPWVSVI